MNEDYLKKILEDHKKWLNDCGGSQANLRGANLCDADLRGANLRRAILCGANLCDADLCDANLRGADLRDVNLRRTYLNRADLRRADLRRADVRESDLQGANLREADLRRADLRETNLCDADLRGAKMSQKIVQVGPIGSRNDYTVYRVDEDIVQCGCWEEYMGGSLADFIARINETYPEDDKNNMKYRCEYLAAIAMFQAVREYYLRN